MTVTVYGCACLLVVLLGLAERQSLPYAVILASGWLAGFLPVEVWWFISLAELAAMTAVLTRWTHWRFKVIAMCVPLMLLLDSYYWLMKGLGVYVGVEYANELTALLTIQLFLCGMGGGWNLGRSAFLWSRGLLNAWLSGRGRLSGAHPIRQASRSAK